jgi:4-alpha-glucanotransferase
MAKPEYFLQQSAAKKQWNAIGINHHHGINIPLFSLRSKKSCGIGEFPDLIPLFSWCREAGFDVVQLLPLNDTGKETSPYSALSAFALNPMHLGLASLPYLDRFPDLQSKLAPMQAMSKSKIIHYPEVYEARRSFLQEYFNAAYALFISDPDYQHFLKNNSWLKGYALFKALKESKYWQSWEQWPEELRDPKRDDFQQLIHKYQREIDYHSFVQHLCFQQLEKVKIAAEQEGVFLKGDIPILINRESADVWLHRHLFHLEYSAGAPPDFYNSEGQNWGFPIYNWEEHIKQNYRWWRQRLKVASHFYHIYRIDHVVGFFRIWAIPKGKPGREGKFIPEERSSWIPQGEKILRMMLEESVMLPIGEDLGSIPPLVRTCLTGLGICGTKVMRWERMWEEDKRFIKPEDYPVASMTTVSTHDSETLQLWWMKNIYEIKDFCKYKGWSFTYDLLRSRHREILWDSHHSASLFHINLLQEYFPLIPGLSWLDAEDERINVPGIVSNKNWTYRFRPYVEEIIANNQLKLAIRDVIE